MHLTRFPINKARTATKELLRSPQVAHAAVMATSPDQHRTAQGRTLWRIDRHAGAHHLYIVSPFVPDLTGLNEQFGWPTRPDIGTVRPYHALLDRLKAGQTWRFRLTANPVRSAMVPGARGKKTPLTAVTDQLEWLTRRAQAHGFHVTDALVTDNRQVKFLRGEAPLSLRTATFEGALTIADVEAFRSTLTNGIGRARAYGCGMLTIAPA